MQCITSAHGLVEAFLHIDVDLLRTLPVFNYMRLLYAIFILEILSPPPTNTSLYDYPMISRETLRMDLYTTCVIKHLERTVGPESKIPAKFLRLMLRLQNWLSVLSTPSDTNIAAEQTLPQASGRLESSAQLQNKHMGQPMNTSDNQDLPADGNRRPFTFGETRPQSPTTISVPFQDTSFPPFADHPENWLMETAGLNGRFSAPALANDVQMDVDPEYNFDGNMDFSIDDFESM